LIRNPKDNYMQKDLIDKILKSSEIDIRKEKINKIFPR